MNRFSLYLALLSLTAMSLAFASSDEHDIQNAVTLALNGTLSIDHIGPDKAAQAERLIKQNAAQANKIVLETITKAENKHRLEDLYVANVIRLTKENDKAGAVQVLEKFTALLDAAAAEVKANPPTKTDQIERHNNRLQRVDAAREQATKLKEDISK